MKKSSVTALAALIFVLAALANVKVITGEKLQRDQIPTLQECKVSFEKFLMSINVAAQMTNPDLLSCVGGASTGCCRAIHQFIGEDSPIYGCSCHKELLTEAWDVVYELAPVVSPGSNLAYIPVARPIVMQRIKECDIPTMENSMCPDLEDAAGNASASQVVGAVTIDPAVAAQGTSITIPQFNQTSAMVEYSAPYERILEGFDEYGWFNPCSKLDDAQYCLASLQAPDNFMQVRYGICAPASSSASTLAAAISETSPEHYEKYPPVVDCTVMNKKPLGIGGIVVSTIFALMFGLVIVGTCVKLIKGRSCSLAMSAIESFDFCTNWQQLMAKPQAGKDIDLRTLNGLRALSMFWVILGHTLTYIVWITGVAFPGRLINPNNINMVVKEWFISFYSGAYFAVDTFFFLSGLLVAFIVSREIEKRKSKSLTLFGELSFWVIYAVNRFLRLLPVFAAVLFFFWKVAPSLSSGPWWDHNWSRHSEDCAKYWWSDLLFLNNFIPIGNPSDGLAPTTCVGGTWYLAVDTQLYIFVAPVILAAWHYGFYINRMVPWRKAISSTISVILVLISILLAAYTTVKRNVWLQYFGEGNFYYYYVKPWIRAPPYILGMMVGLILHHFITEELGHKRLQFLKEKAPAWIYYVMVATAIGILSALVFPIASYFDTDYDLPPITTTHSAGWSREAVIVYNTFKFFAWGFGLTLLVLPAVLGRVKILTEILGGHLWGPFAKLTYGAYLIHMLYPQAVLTSTDASTGYYHTVNTMGMWMIFSFGSYFWAGILYLVIEAPCNNLQKILMSVLNGKSHVKRKLTDAQPKMHLPMKSVVVQEELHQRTPRTQREQEMIERN